MNKPARTRIWKGYRLFKVIWVRCADLRQFIKRWYGWNKIWGCQMDGYSCGKKFGEGMKEEKKGFRGIGSVREKVKKNEVCKWRKI